MRLIHGLTRKGEKNLREFSNKEGGVYFTDTMDVYFKEPGGEKAYFTEGRDVSVPVNTRLGLYYSETHIRKSSFAGYPHLMDLTYNTLPNTLHINYKFIYKEAYTAETSFGVELKVDSSAVAKIEIKDKNGVHDSVAGVDPRSVEYVAFDIQRAGTAGLIYPADSLYTEVSVVQEDGYYLVNSVIQLPSAVSGTVYNLNLQMYNDVTHSFAGIQKAAYIERNPVEVSITDSTNSRASFAGYDSATGMYRITEENNFYDFNYGYYVDPNFYMYADLKIKNDGQERPIYIWVNSNVGCMECAFLLDKEKRLLAVPMEVCKNFNGEYEDRIYDPEDKAYGDTFFPVYLTAGEEIECTAVQYVQNWGKYALQQISSIQFFATYYHMSTGATETTCIAPMGVFGKDGYTLPDFRGCSGEIWDTQPQYYHAGDTYFTSMININKNKKTVLSEYTGSQILSAGPTYGEMKYSYICDTGEFRYTLTHLEFPQNDESRNYYTYELEFLEDLNLAQVKEYFNIMSYQFESAGFRSYAYRDRSGRNVSGSNGSNDQYYVLNKEYSYFAFYNSVNGGVTNYSILIKDFDVTVGGEKWDGNLAVNVKNNLSGGARMNSFALTLDAEDLYFRKGDTIRIHMILLPYGPAYYNSCSNVLRVAEDSILKPMQATAAVGNVEAHPYMARIRAAENQAQFTVRGSRNLNTVRVDGFTSDRKPVIEEFTDGQWVLYDNSVESFDGYGAHYNEDNTYGFSFVVDMGEEGADRTFRIRQ